jgi:hypothetical protein
MRKNRNTSNFLVIAMLGLLFTFLFGCTTKKVESEFVFKEISEEFKQYTAFDSASYWVYQKTASGIPIIDTIRVIKVNSDRRFHYDVTTDGFYYDAYELSLTSKYIGFTKSEVTAGTAYQGSTMNENYRVYLNNGRYFSIFTPKYPRGEVQHLGQAEGDYTNVGFSSQMTINGRQYTDVYHTRVVDNPGNPAEAVMEFYFAKDFGLVMYTKKQQLNDSTAFNDEWLLTKAVLISHSR